MKFTLLVEAVLLPRDLTALPLCTRPRPPFPYQSIFIAEDRCASLRFRINMDVFNPSSSTIGRLTPPPLAEVSEVEKHKQTRNAWSVSPLIAERSS